MREGTSSGAIIRGEPSREIDTIEDLEDLAKYRCPPRHRGNCILVVTSLMGRFIATMNIPRDFIQEVEASHHERVMGVSFTSPLATAH